MLYFGEWQTLSNQMLTRIRRNNEELTVNFSIIASPLCIGVPSQVSIEPGRYKKREDEDDKIARHCGAKGDQRRGGRASYDSSRNLNSRNQ